MIAVARLRGEAPHLTASFDLARGAAAVAMRRLDVSFYRAARLGRQREVKRTLGSVTDGFGIDKILSLLGGQFIGE